MSDINTDRSGSILRVEVNRPERKKALTAAMYTRLADIFNEAAEDEEIRVVLWHGAGDTFSAGNDLGDFLKNPPGPGNFPQGHLMDALIRFEKPIVAAVQGAAIGGGTTMLTHCDFVYAGESAKFQVPFINLALVPEFGSSFSVPARMGASPCGGIVPAGRAFYCHAGGGAGLGDPRGARPGSARDRHRNRAEAGGKTERRVAGEQAADKTGFNWPDQRGCSENRTAGVL
jgi:enoyl-CoA hydratase/carnithine racemase